MKNIQVIDGADNCTYSVYQVSERGFRLLFPGKRDIEFIGDAIARLGRKRVSAILAPAWKRELSKKQIVGIHGTLFYELDKKKKFYPTKRESEMAGKNHIL